MLWLFLSVGESLAEGKEVNGSCTKPQTSPKEEINGPPGMLIPSRNAVSSIPFTSNFHEGFSAEISEQVYMPLPETTRTSAVLPGVNSIEPAQCIEEPLIQPMPLVFNVLVLDNFCVHVLPPLVDRYT